MGVPEFDRVESWESRPFEGREDLHSIAEGGFSGAVRAGGTWVFLLNGRVVGEFGGTVDDILDDSGDVYTAPHPGLPLLLTMQTVGGETRAQYYTNDTPLSEVDETLSSSNFTGYIELSENVLSGDYYVLYYGGRSMSIAFVGERSELITDAEAFERANDEVGIFEVVAADIEVKDVPQPTAESGATASPDPEPERRASESAEEGGMTDTPAEEGEQATPESTAEASRDTTATELSPEPGASGSTGQGSVSDGTTADDGPEPGVSGSTGDGVTDDPPEEGHAEEEHPTREPTEGVSPDTAPTDDGGVTDEAPADERPPVDGAAPVDTDDDIVDNDMFSREEEWRETATIPALDPDDTAPGELEGADDESSPETSTDTDGERSVEAAAGVDGSEPGDSTEATDRVQELETALEKRRSELETLRARVEELAETRDELREERDRLAERIEKLEHELETARSTDTAVETTAGDSLEPEEAISGTNLFVQYASRGEATLADAHDGADSEAVNDNLRLKHHHTGFDPEGVSVGGRPFEEFLGETPEYRFVNWALRELPYEIRETGHDSDLGDLYDVIPEIDRVELHGDVEIADEGENEGGSWPFDVIFRDNTGTVLLVADVNDTRTEVDRETVESLLTAADDISETSGLAAAFCLAASLFTDRAHDAVEEATGGSLLSRNTQKSFVQTGRKTGYHLCLVRYPEGSFDLVSPKL